MLPPLNLDGDLPAGVHGVTLGELRDMFGSSNRARSILFRRLERIHQIAAGTGHLARFVVFGSFVTDKDKPNDVDVFMIFDEAFNAGAAGGEVILLLDHATADAHFGASVFWLRRPAILGDEQAMIEFWQTKRDGNRRGIVEILEDSDDQ